MTQPHRTVPALRIHTEATPEQLADPAGWLGPMPIACRLCDGEGTLPVVSYNMLSGLPFVLRHRPCPGCSCGRCGETTSTPPLCADCADDIGDRAYERGRDR